MSEDVNAELPPLDAPVQPSPSSEAANAAQAAEAAAAAAQQEQAQQEAADLAELLKQEEAAAIAATLAALAAANPPPLTEPLHALDILQGPEGGFGPSFRSELIAAGVDTYPMMVGKESIVFGPTITEEQRAEVVAVITAHDRTKPEPGVAPADISRRQFYQQAQIGGYIDEDEMVDAMGGKIPQVLLTKVNNTLPDAYRIPAKAYLAGATTFQFGNPFVLQLGQMMEPPMDEAAMRLFWSDAAKLL